MMKLAVISTLMLAGSAMAGGDNLLKLTEKTFDAKVKDSGANSIVKFFAPWCGHCKAMAPAWIELADDNAGDSSVNIAEVDCTVENALCSKYGVSGYPTIKYFKQDDGFEAKDYQGGRDKTSFQKFVDENLAVPCTPAKQEKCTDKQKEYITKMEKKDLADIEKELERLKKMGAAKVSADKLAWLMQRKALLPHIIKAKEEL